MHAMATGANVRHCFTLTDGRRITGPQILLLYLEWIDKHIKLGILPEWAEEELMLICDLVNTLDQHGLSALCGVCDHATLYHLWNVTLDTYGVTSDRAAKYASLIGNSWGRYRRETSAIHDLITEQMSVLKGEAREYWHALHAFMPIAYEYGDIMSGGLFNTLKKAGVSAQGDIFTEDDLAPAVHLPPPQNEGRCHARAQVIFQLAKQQGAASVGWDLVRSEERGVFDLEQLQPSKPYDWQSESTYSVMKNPSRRAFGALFDYMDDCGFGLTISTKAAQ